jgi:hypothetical protein
MSFEPGAGEVLYHRKGGGVAGPPVETLEPAECLARLLQHVPEPRLHQVRYYGHYSNVARAQRAAAEPAPEAVACPPGTVDAEPTAAEHRRRRKLWAQLIRRVYEVDPLLCRECGGKMRILAFVLEVGAIRKILAHRERAGGHPARPPPPDRPAESSIASSPRAS